MKTRLYFSGIHNNSLIILFKGYKMRTSKTVDDFRTALPKWLKKKIY